MTMRRAFLVGVPRSGTTLLQSLIGCSPDVATFTESKLFGKGFTLRLKRPVLVRSPFKLARDFCSENGLTIAGLPKFGALGVLRSEFSPTTAARYFINVLDYAAHQSGKRCWLEKTPSHLYHIDLIERTLAPESAHFVHLIRDGVSVAASFASAARLWAGKRPVSRVLRLGRPISALEAQRRWESDLKLSLGYARRKNHHIVVYEDLIADPEKISLKLSEVLGIALSAEDLADRGNVLNRIRTADEVWKMSVGSDDIARRDRVSEYITEQEREWLEKNIDRTSYDALRAVAVR